MGYFAYLLDRIKRATSDAHAFGKEHFAGSLIALVASAIGAAWAADNGGDALASQLPTLVGAGIIGPLVVVSAAFITFWIIAPYKIYQEQKTAIKILSPPERHPLDYTIRLIGVDSPMPPVVLPEGMNVFRIHGSIGVGMTSTMHAPGTPFPWGPPDMPSTVIKCTFENFGDEQLLAIEADLEIFMQEALPTENGAQSGKIIGVHKIKSPYRSLSAHSNFSFFVSNETTNFGFVRLPETARIKRVGNSEWEIIRLDPPPPYTYAALYPFQRPNPVAEIATVEPLGIS